LHILSPLFAVQALEVEKFAQRKNAVSPQDFEPFFQFQALEQ
jgi:hypothetical protein